MLTVGFGIGVSYTPTLGGVGAGVNDLLMETGDHLLLQSGTSDVLILE